MSLFSSVFLVCFLLQTYAVINTKLVASACMSVFPQSLQTALNAGVFNHAIKKTDPITHLLICVQYHYALCATHYCF